MALSSTVPTSRDDETVLALKQAVKELTKNETYNYKAMLNCSKVVDEFLVKVSGFSSELEGIKDNLKETPNMLNIGKELELLKASLAAYEATLSDLKLNLHDSSHSAASVSDQQLDGLNVTLQTQIALINEDLHHQHVYCCLNLIGHYNLNSSRHFLYAGIDP